MNMEVFAESMAYLTANTGKLLLGKFLEELHLRVHSLLPPDL